LLEFNLLKAQQDETENFAIYDDDQISEAMATSIAMAFKHNKGLQTIDLGVAGA
jgi:hypothetical protein